MTHWDWPEWDLYVGECNQEEVTRDRKVSNKGEGTHENNNNEDDI